MQLKITWDTAKVTPGAALLAINEQKEGKHNRLLEEHQFSKMDTNLMEMSEFQSYFQKERLLKLFSPIKSDDVPSCKQDRLLAHVPRMHWDKELTGTE